MPVTAHGFFFSSRRRHTSYIGDWSSDVCSSDLSDRDDHVDLARPRPGPTEDVRPEQIGRASCRERVEMSEGGRSLKKKQDLDRPASGRRLDPTRCGDDSAVAPPHYLATGQRPTS